MPSPLVGPIDLWVCVAPRHVSFPCVTIVFLPPPIMWLWILHFWEAWNGLKILYIYMQMPQKSNCSFFQYSQIFRFEGPGGKDTYNLVSFHANSPFLRHLEWRNNPLHSDTNALEIQPLILSISPNLHIWGTRRKGYSQLSEFSHKFYVSGALKMG